MFDILSWFSWFNSPWLNAFSWFSIAGVGLVALAAYFLGLRPLLEGFFSGVVWFVKNVLWEGVKDIFDAWVTIVTVLCVAFALFTALEIKQEAAITKIENKLEACKVEVKNLRKYIPKLPKDFGKTKPWYEF